MPFFETIDLLPDDPILKLPALFAADSRSPKVNLGVGIYKDSEGKSIVLNAVRAAEAILQENKPNKDYPPIEGDPSFLKESMILCFGKDSPAIDNGQIFAANTLGGTGALRLGGEFMAQENSRTLFLPDPSWPNHRPVFQHSGLKIRQYPYYDPISHRLDFEGMCAAIKCMPPGSIILLQACCHNPTGVDLSFEQWKEISSLIKTNKILPFFDFAYQGFGESIDADAQSIRYFLKEGHEMLIASSYSKNFGLYGERVGVLFACTQNRDTTRKIGSQLKQIIRGMYSMPPLHGARIVTTILQTPNLKKEWMDELANMRDRIREMRQTLVAGLVAKSAHNDFNFLNNQVGIFSFCGLNSEQVDLLQKKYAIYMPSNGRINIAGLNPLNMNYVIDAILSVR